jgi:autotransporter-associated beta strand protein
MPRGGPLMLVFFWSALALNEVPEMSTLDLDGMNVTLPDGTVFTTSYLTGSDDVTNSGLLDATLTEGGGPAGTTYSGTISDGTHATTAITQTSGEVTFTGSSTYSGGTNLDGGIIGITNGSALGTGTLTIAGGTLLAAAGVDFTNAIDFAGAGTIDNNGYDIGLNDSLFSGAGPLTITGSGQVGLEITNPTTYSGDVFLNSGTLTFVGGNPFSSLSSESIGTGTLHLAAGTTLNLPGGSKFVTPANLTSNIELDGAATITSSYGYINATPDLDGTISGSGSLTIDGPLFLAGNNTYTGGTVIDGAVFVSGSIVGNITDYGMLTFSNAQGTNFSGQISGDGSVAAYDLLTLSGANSYSGGTTIYGYLLVANNLALGTGSVGFSGGILESGAPNIALANAITTINPGSAVEVTTGGWTLTLDGPQSLINNGMLEAAYGTLIVDETVTGTGTALISGGGTIDFNSNFQQTVTLGGLGNTLGLSQLYNGTISGFAAADAIDFTSLAYKSSYDVVWVQNGSQGMVAIEDTATDTVVDSVTLDGTYYADSFRLAMDSQGGTEIIGAVPPTYDFTANGKSDVLFQNINSDQVYEWLMNGTTVTSSGFVGNNTNPSWEVITGAGDYNGDGNSDILWQNVSTGQIYEYQMNGTAVLASNFVGNNTDPEWQAVGSGDFNGDGYSDILFQNTVSGQVFEWEMNGFSVIGSGAVGNNTSPSWQVVGIGDFNGDGKSDILLQNVTTGQVDEWEMNGTSVIASGVIGNNTDPTWKVVGTGDFNGNGNSDILFQNVTTGQVYEWEMNGLSVIGSGFIGNNTNPALQVVGTGDYSGNGSADILFQNSTTGQMVEWLMNGTSVIGSSVVGNNTDPTWHAIAKS